MKGFVTKWLRRLRSTRGFTMTETLLGMAVTGLLVVGVCAAVVNASTSTKETDVVEFFEVANQDAVSAFRSNAQLSQLNTLSPFNDGFLSSELKDKEGNTYSKTFTAYYDANMGILNPSTGYATETQAETAAAYKAVYTATAVDTEREGYTFYESTVNLDIGNYERSKSNNWVLREHNKNMNDATGADTGTGVTVRVLSLNEDPNATKTTPVEPDIDPVIPEIPETPDNTEETAITLRADITDGRYFWDITRSDVYFTTSGGKLVANVQPRDKTSLDTNESSDGKKLITKSVGNVSTLKGEMDGQKVRIYLEVVYNYVNVKGILDANPNYTVVIKNDPSGAGARIRNAFNGNGAYFAFKDVNSGTSVDLTNLPESEQAKNLKTLLGLSDKTKVTVSLLPIQNKIDGNINGTQKVTVTGSYAIHYVPGKGSWFKERASEKGPFTIAFHDNGVINNKRYYRVAIYNREGINIMGSTGGTKMGDDRMVNDYIYFGFGDKKVDSINLTVYQSCREWARLYGYGSPAQTWSVTGEAQVGLLQTSKYTVEVKKYTNMSDSKSDITISNVYIATSTGYITEPLTDDATLWFDHPQIRDDTALDGIFGGGILGNSYPSSGYGWWPGNTKTFGNVSGATGEWPTWYTGQTEPQDTGYWKDKFWAASSNNPANKTDGKLLPTFFEFKKTS